MRKAKRFLALLLAAVLALSVQMPNVFAQENTALEYPENMPDYVGTAEDVLLRVDMPSDAQSMYYRVDALCEGEDARNLVWGELSSKNPTGRIAIEAKQLELDTILFFEFIAEYPDGGSERITKKVPVLGQIAWDTPIQVVNDADPMHLPCNKELRIGLQNQSMTSVNVYGGFDYLGEDYADERGYYELGLSYGSSEDTVIFAKMCIDGVWCYTPPMELHTEVYGQAGLTTATLDNEYCAQGTMINVSYTPAENADTYYLELERKDPDSLLEDEGWEYYGRYAMTNTNTASFSTVTLLPGEYRAWACAQGEGYVERRAELPISMGISEADIPESGVLFTVSDTEVYTGDQVQLSYIAPGADFCELWVDKDGDKCYNWYKDGESGDVTHNFNESGEYEVYVMAYFYDHDEYGNPINDTERIAESERYVMHINSNGEYGFAMPPMPEYVVAGQEQSVVIQMPEEAERMDVHAWLEGGMGYGEDIYEGHSDGGDIEMVISGDSLEADTVLCVSIGIFVKGYDYSSMVARIPVISEITDRATISIANQDEWEMEDKLYVAEDVVFAVEGENLEEVRFSDGYSTDYDTPAPDSNGVYKKRTCFWEKGEFFAFARVKFTDDDAWYTTNILRIQTESRGQAGPFTISCDAETVKRGEPIVVRMSESENATWYNVRLWKDGEELWPGYSIKESNEIVLMTNRFEPGTYTLSGIAGGGGYEERDSDNQLTVVVEESDVPNGTIKFTVSDTEVETMEPFMATLIAPGAEKVNYMVNGESRLGYDGLDDDSVCDIIRFGNAGEYTLKGCAMFNGEWVESEEVKVNVTAEGSIVIEQADIPDFVVHGDKLEIAVPKPEDAEIMTVRVVRDGNDGYQEPLLWLETSDSADYRDGINAYLETQDIEPGTILRVEVQATGRGKNEARLEKRVPIVMTPNEGIILEVENEGEPVMVGQNIEIEVVSTGNTPIRLFDGYSLREAETTDENGRFVRDIRFNEPGEYSVYVVLEGDEGLAYSRIVRFTVEARGEVGPFDFASHDAVEVKQGQYATFEFTDSENADEYHVDIWKVSDGENEQGEHMNDIWQTSESHVVTVDTSEIPVGEYIVRGHASGYGYTGRESDGEVSLIVTEKPQQEEHSVELTLSATKVQTHSGVSATVEATGDVESITLYKYNDDIPEHAEPRIWEDGERIHRTDFAWSESGTYKVYAEVKFADLEEPVLSEVQYVEVYAPNGQLPQLETELPERMIEGVDAHIKVYGGSDNVRYSVRVEEGDPETFDWRNILDEWDLKETKEYTIDGDEIHEGKDYVILIEACAPGYDPAITRVDIRSEAMPMIDRTVKVVWNDDNDKDGIRGPISAWVNGEPIPVEEENDWTVNINMPMYEKDGSEVACDIEMSGLQCYEITHDGDIYTYTLKHEKPVELPGIDADCSHDGKTEGLKCEACGTVITPQEVIPSDPSAHVWSEWTVIDPGTCTVDGKKECVCEICGQKAEAVIEALGHVPGESIHINPIEASCTEDGSYDDVVHCVNCGEVMMTYTVVVKAKGHNWSAWKVDTKATTTKAGSKHRTCSVCGETETASIAKLKNLSKGTVSGLKTSYGYTGKAIKPSLTVKYGKTKLKEGTDYKVSYSSNTKIGTAKIKITGTGKYGGSISKTFKITKGSQPMKVSAKAISKKYSTLKKKAQTVKVSDYLSISKAQGTKKFAISSNGKIKGLKVNSKTGALTIPKGTKKGTYKVKIKITAGGNSKYKSGSKTVTVKVVVK